MTNVYSTLPRLAVKDSFDDDELTDIDDEVFIRDGKTGGILKLHDDGGVKRPLMAVRRKTKATNSYETRRVPLKALLVPVCYGAMALVVLLGLVLLGIVTVNIFPIPFTMFKNFFSGSKVTTTTAEIIPEVLPCTSLASTVVWTRTLPKSTSEAPLRSLDVNSDGIDDIVVGFSTGLDTLDAPEFICKLHFEGQEPCLGGVMALDGKTGETLWTHWAEHAIFSMDCTQDITDDKIKDCIITGRGGILKILDGSDGSAVWEVARRNLPLIEQEDVISIYDARYIADCNGDDVADVIAAHTSQAGQWSSSEVVILSGKTGTVVRNVLFSKSDQLLIAPQTILHPDGEVLYLLASMTPDASGGLYIVRHTDILAGNMELRTLQHGKGKGVLFPPILMDITRDGTDDIIVPSLDSTIVAYDGLTFLPIWNYTVADSETVSVPIPGYYNDDKIPDFMVKHQLGPLESLTTILDGKTGRSLLENPMKGSQSGPMSGLTLSVEGSGNDWYLYWSASCADHDKTTEKYRFLKTHKLLSQSRANLCKLRFNATLSTRLRAMSQHVGPPGQTIYFSDDWRATEFNDSFNTRKEMEKYLKKISTRLDAMNPVLKGPVLPQQPDESVLVNSRPDPENIQILDEQADYFLKNSNEKKGAEGYSVYNEEAKASNDFPVEFDWPASNSWDNLQLDKQYDMQYSDRDDLEAAQRMEDRRQRRKEPVPPRKTRDTSTKDQFPYAKGVPRLPPTGILLPSLSQSSRSTSSDLVFSTYWLPPSDVSLLLLHQDLECIRQREDKILRKITAYERESIIAECLAERGVDYKLYKERFDRENIKSGLGQMTIYRVRLECVCPDDMLPGQACKNVSRLQNWPAHLGRMGDGYFRV